MTIKALRTDSIEKDRRENRIYAVLRGWDEGGNPRRKKLGAGKAQFTVLSPAESVPQQGH